MRLVAAALAFAIVLSLAGVLGKLLLRGNHHTGDCRGACGCLRLAGNGLGVEARGRAAEEAGESGGQSEVAYSSGFHEEFLFFGWSRRCARKLSLTRYSWPETGVEVLFPCRMFEA